jgi:hypothetical protein
MKTFGQFMFVVLVVTFVVLVVLYTPYFTIWALNTLFKTDIEYNWSTWAAVIWCNVAILGTMRGSKSSS